MKIFIKIHETHELDNAQFVKPDGTQHFQVLHSGFKPKKPEPD